MLYRPFEPSVESKPTIDTKSGGLGTSTKKTADKLEPTWLDKAGSAFEKAQARFARTAPKPDPIKLYNKPEFTLGPEYEGGARGFTDPDNPYGTTFPSQLGSFHDDDEPKSTTGIMGIGPDGEIVEYGLPETYVLDATSPYRAIPTRPAIQTGELEPAIQDTSDEEKQALIDMEEAAIARIKKVDDVITNKMNKDQGASTKGLMARPDFSPIEEAIKEKTAQFYVDIGKKAESDHGSIPKPTNDKAEENIPEAQRSKDVGFGHKVKDSEDTSGKIHGITFKNSDGTYKALTEAQKIEILNKDMAEEVALARKEGWDSKLKKLGISWDELDYKYKNALTSLAFNVGGVKAGKEWTAVLKAAKDRDVKEFAKQMRRQDSGAFTEGMDNRVARELYYSGIINNVDEVSSVLPLLNSINVSDIPQSSNS